MKLASMNVGGEVHAALVLDDGLVDLTLLDGVNPYTSAALLCAPERLNAYAAAEAPRLAPDEVHLLAPVPRPGKVFGVGMNYRSFVAAAKGIGMAVPDQRVWFLRPTDGIVGPDAEVILPDGATDLDYEVELAVVIGRRCRNANLETARQAIGGYCIANDFTLRDAARESLVKAKSFATHLPLGPWIVPADRLGDAGDLRLRAYVNEELRQESSTAEMIADPASLIAELSRACILEPGDLLLTGTPSGCGIFRPAPWGLRAGDALRLEIDGIGVLSHRIVAEQAVETMPTSVPGRDRIAAQIGG